ncbi:MAG: Mu-like prophage major head subunit gpT family protein [Fuerstiella sp.]
MPKFLRNKRDKDKTIQTRQFQCRNETWNEEARTVEAVIATEAPVMVYDWRSEQMVQEVLRMDLITMPEGSQIVLLDSHARWSLDTVLGSIRDIRSEGSDLIGTLHFVEGDPDVDKVVRKVAQGHIRDISVGYRVRAYEQVRRGETLMIRGVEYTAETHRMLIAVDWEPHEGSLTAVGADSNSKLRDASEEALSHRSSEHKTPDSERSDSDHDDPADPGEESERTMPKTVPADESATNEDQIRTARQEAVAEERSRVASIREIGGKDVRSQTIDKAIEDGLSAEQFRSVALDDLRAQRAVTPPAGADIPNIQIDSDKRHARDFNERATAIAFAMKLGAKDPARHMARVDYDESTGETFFEPSDYRALEGDRKEIERDAERAYQIRRMAPSEISEEMLRMAEVEKPMGRRQMVTRAMSTPQASAIYTQSTGAALLEFMGNVYDSTQGWLQEREANSFKSQELVKLEGGRLKHRRRGRKAAIAEFSDVVEKYKVNEFARTLMIDRQDQVDDELGAWATAVDEFARAIAALRPDLVYSVLMQNVALSDGKALFDAGHKNDLTGALGQGTLQAVLTALSKQKNSSGVPLNLQGKHLIVGADEQFKAKQLANSSETRGTNAEDGTLNALQDMGLIVHHESRLSTGFNAPISEEAIAPAPGMFFGAADRGAYGLVYGTLNGTNGLPTIGTNVVNSGGKYGIELDVAAVGGCGASGYQGIVRSN